MALSYLLRSAQIGCKLRPTVGSAALFGRFSSASFHNVDFTQRRVEQLPPITFKPILPKISQIARHFSVSPIVKSAVGGHDHSKLWTYEKALSLGLLGICPLGIMFPNVLFDIIMAVAAVMHTHWGFEAIIVDYVRPVLFGNLIPKVTLGLLYVFSIFMLVGLLNLTFNNSGIGNGIRLLWKM